MTIGERLREERERLQLSQPAFAAIAGTTKQTLYSWETGKTAPDGFQMAALAEAGVDALYVLVGQRSKPLSPEEQLPRVEQEWLALYRNSTAEVRAALKAAGDELAKPARKGGKAA